MVRIVDEPQDFFKAFYILTLLQNELFVIVTSCVAYQLNYFCCVNHKNPPSIFFLVFA